MTANLSSFLLIQYCRFQFYPFFKKTILFSSTHEEKKKRVFTAHLLDSLLDGVYPSKIAPLERIGDS